MEGPGPDVHVTFHAGFCRLERPITALLSDVTTNCSGRNYRAGSHEKQPASRLNPPGDEVEIPHASMGREGCRGRESIRDGTTLALRLLE